MFYIISLPLHCSHKRQPLVDKTFMEVFKSYHSEETSGFANILRNRLPCSRNGSVQLTKPDILNNKNPKAEPSNRSTLITPFNISADPINKIKATNRN